MHALHRILLPTVVFMTVYSTTCLATDMSYYKDVPTTRILRHECDTEDLGSEQVSCKYIETGSIDGQLFSNATKDPRWQKWEKYYNDPSHRLKFAGIACGRAKLESDAEGIAETRARSLVKSLVEDFEAELFTGALADLGYRKDAGGVTCVATKNTQGQVSSTSGNESIQQGHDVPSPKDQSRSRSSDSSRTVVFRVRNDNDYSVDLKFWDGPRKHVWPGSDTHWSVAANSENTYSLSCQPGQKVCIGAWDPGNPSSGWGLGHQGNSACTACCATCGGQGGVRLNRARHYDPPPPPVAENNGNGNVANQILQGVTLGLGIAGALAPALQNRAAISSPSVIYKPRPPAHQSDITGLGN